MSRLRVWLWLYVDDYPAGRGTETGYHRETILTEGTGP
jgi:hypothetical protein